MKRIVLVALALPIALGLHGISQASGVEAQLPKPQSFRVGDTWSYSLVSTKNGTLLERRDHYSNRRVEEVNAKTVVFADGDLDGYFVRTPSLGARAPYGMRQSPWRQWPLYVGRKWRYWGDQLLPDNRIVNAFQDAEVVAFEEVNVPAGKFMAFRIEYRGAGTRNDPKRLRKIAKDGPSGVEGDWAINETYWYAPAVNMDVKFITRRPEGEHAVELKSYVRGEKK